MDQAYTTEELVTLALAGDRQAFDRLYDQTIQVIYRTVHFLVGNSSDAEDIVQETYVEMYRNLSKFKEGRAFQPWLIGIAIRQVNAYRRKKWMRFRLFQKASGQGTEIEADFAPDVVDRLANRELVAMLEQLPYKLKQVVILRYLNEYSQEEVAAILEIPVGTVKSRLHAALSKLRGLSKTGFQMSQEVEKHGYGTTTPNRP